MPLHSSWVWAHGPGFEENSKLEFLDGRPKTKLVPWQFSIFEVASEFGLLGSKEPLEESAVGS